MPDIEAKIFIEDNETFVVTWEPSPGPFDPILKISCREARNLVIRMNKAKARELLKALIKASLEAIKEEK